VEGQSVSLAISTNKTCYHDIAEILLKVMLNTYSLSCLIWLHLEFEQFK
jgi:hypothetical protein